MSSVQKITSSIVNLNTSLPYFTNFDFETKAYDTDKIPGTQTDITFPLSCWANYTFRVKAVNRLGDSDPSEIAPVPCYTNPCRPTRQPIGVRAFGTAPNNLIITWNV